MKKFIDAEIDIKLLTTEEALLVDYSFGTPDLDGDGYGDDLGWEI